MTRTRIAITISLILLTILSFLVDAVLLLNVYGNGEDGEERNGGSLIRPTGCIAGTFSASYQRQAIDFTVNRVFLCGTDLRYLHTNAEGLRVYNEKEED